MVGLDVGGANLKFVCLESDQTSDVPFALWRQPDQLYVVIERSLRTLPKCQSLAVTMTGELADCFEDRRHGVMHIVEHVGRAARRCGIAEVGFYGTDGQFHSSESAGEKIDALAASNWHALAIAVGLRIASDALLIDIGSTTTDVIAICKGQVLTSARSDRERLIDRSLVYVGCRRTPICALIESVVLKGNAIPVMKEVFATVDDARLILKLQPEDPDDRETSDGGTRTIAGATKRLARMLGRDPSELSAEHAAEFARQVVAAVSSRIDAAVAHWRRERGDVPLVLSGHGQTLLSMPPNIQSIDLRLTLGSAVSRCAPSWAVANLWLHRRS